ncbi:MAG: hypothetical protein O7G29_07425 [Acidobacteria bacterium]|nr:hypothetical protein [Acidobacteriota bacterium]
MSRSVMLQKIRRACVGADSAELPTELPEFPHYSDPVAKFRQELEKVGAVFLDGRRSEELSAALSVVLKQSDSTEIYWEGEELFQKHGLSFTLRNPETFAKGDLLYSFHFRHKVKFPIILNSKPYERSDLGCELSTGCSVKGVVHPSLFGNAEWKMKPSAPKGELEWTSTTMPEPAQEVES